jgi:molecular chaperone DnaK
VPQIEVSFDIDASGIINVSAKDLGTSKEQKMTITASTKLAEADVKKMVSEAKEFEEQDKQRKEEVEVRNSADSLVYTAEKTKSDLAGKISTDLIDKVNAAIVAVKAALEGKDTGKIKSELEKLQKVMGEAGSAVYQETARQQAQSQAGAQPGAEGNGSPRQETTGPGGEKVVDADFKVKEDT